MNDPSDMEVDMPDVGVSLNSFFDKDGPRDSRISALLQKRWTALRSIGQRVLFVTFLARSNSARSAPIRFAISEKTLVTPA